MERFAETQSYAWLRCYRCWSTDLEVQVHYEGIHKIDPTTGERSEVVDEVQEAVVQCLECMHDQPHLGFSNGRVEGGPVVLGLLGGDRVEPPLSFEGQRRIALGLLVELSLLHFGLL